MQTLKTVLSVVIVVALLSAVAVGVFWEKLLSPEQKLRYGKQFSAVEDLRLAAAADPTNPEALRAYVDALVIEGNVGRAWYLSELYGLEHEGATQLRNLCIRAMLESSDGAVLDITAQPEAEQFADTPAWEVLRYLEGYRHALSGDWMSARNEFMAIRNGELPEALRGWHRYYLARSYRFGGDEEQKTEVSRLLQELLDSEEKQGRSGGMLYGRTLYNLFDWVLSTEYPGTDAGAVVGLNLSKVDNLDEDWARQKAWTVIAEHQLREGLPADAWTLLQLALLSGPQGSGAKGAGEPALQALSGMVAAAEPGGISSREGSFLALAEWAVANEREAETADLLVRLRPLVEDRELWEELRVGEAICYRSMEDAAAMAGLAQDPNLSQMGAGSRGMVHFENGMLLRSEQQWNSAVAELRRAGELGGPRSSEAWFQAYLVLKRVQDPLDEASAISYLQHVVDGSVTDAAFPRGFEEIVPLLIHANSRTAARQLCERVLKLAEAGIEGMDSERASELETVARYWLAWIARESGNLPAANDYRRGIELRHWNYYELTASPEIEPLTIAKPEVVYLQESAGEYFAGMGLTTNAIEGFGGEGLADSQLLAFYRIDNIKPVLGLPDVQWRATEVLESGVVREAALLDYVLQQAYPRPFDDVVLPAAKEFGVEPALIYAVIKKESNFKPDDISWAGAEGLMQLMPESAKWLNERYSLGVDLSNLRDPQQNVRLGAANLASLYDQLGSDNIRGVIIAHNKGAGNYKKWTGRYGSDPILISELVPNEENEGFIKRVYRYYLVYSWLEEH